MAKFVEEDLGNVTIIRCNDVDEDNTHKNYRIIVKDENNSIYQWIDTTTACGCDEATLMAAIKTHVLTLEKKEAPVVPNIVNNKRDDVTGNSLI